MAGRDHVVDCGRDDGLLNEGLGAVLPVVGNRGAPGDLDIATLAVVVPQEDVDLAILVLFELLDGGVEGDVDIASDHAAVG